MIIGFLQRRQVVNALVDTVVVVAVLEFIKLALQVGGIPKQRLIDEFPSDGADQSFDKGMRDWDARDGFDFLDVQYSQIGLPAMKLKQGIMIAA